MNVVLRRAEPRDAALLTSFAAQTFTDSYAAHNTPEDMRAYLAGAFSVEQQTRELSDPAMVTLLAEADGEPVGYAQLKAGEAPACVPQEHPIEIYRFYVDRPAHGTGVAQKLMARAVAEARETGARHLWLAVWERNPRAIAFYRRSGFREADTQYFQLGSDRQTDHV